MVARSPPSRRVANSETSCPRDRQKLASCLAARRRAARRVSCTAGSHMSGHDRPAVGSRFDDVSDMGDLWHLDLRLTYRADHWHGCDLSRNDFDDHILERGAAGWPREQAFAPPA